MKKFKLRNLRNSMQIIQLHRIYKGRNVLILGNNMKGIPIIYVCVICMYVCLHTDLYIQTYIAYVYIYIFKIHI